MLEADTTDDQDPVPPNRRRPFQVFKGIESRKPDCLSLGLERVKGAVRDFTLSIGLGACCQQLGIRSRDTGGVLGAREILRFSSHRRWCLLVWSPEE